MGHWHMSRQQPGFGKHRGHKQGDQRVNVTSVGSCTGLFNLLAFIIYQRDTMPVMCCQMHSTCPSGPWPFTLEFTAWKTLLYRLIRRQYTVAHNLAYSKCLPCQRPIWGPVWHLNLRFRSFKRAGVKRSRAARDFTELSALSRENLLLWMDSKSFLLFCFVFYLVLHIENGLKVVHVRIVT